MESKTRIVVADDNRGLCQLLQSYLQNQEDFQIVGIAYNGIDAWNLVQSQEPDVLIIDLVMPVLDGMGVLEKMAEYPTTPRPKVIMLTAFGQDSLTHQAIMLGVDYFILKPFDLEILKKRIRSLKQEIIDISKSCSTTTPAVSLPENRFNISIEVTAMMHQIGIPAHVKGYQYIRDAILMVVEDISLLGAVTRELYPAIAQKYDTVPSRVERGIRHVIELAWERGHTETLKCIFGYSMNIERQKPTNLEFIALLADKLRIRNEVF